MGLKTSLGRLLSRVATNLIGSDSPSEQPRSPPSPAPQATSATSSVAAGSVAEFEAKLRTAVRVAGTVAAGQVQFMGLEGLRAALGARWEHLSGAAESVVQNIIERRLADFEVYLRVGELKYVMVFPTLDETAARIKCSSIADEIMRRLLGEEEAAAARIVIGTSVAMVDKTHAEKEPDLVKAMQGRLDEDAARQHGELGKPSRATNSIAADVQQRAYGYRPIWDLKNGVIGTYRHVSRLKIAEVTPTNLSPTNAAQLYERDARALEHVIEDAVSMLRHGTRVVLASTVHYSTLTTMTHRQNFHALCCKLPADAHRLVVFELVGAPDGVLPARLEEAITLLKPFSRVVLLRTTLGSKIFKTASEARIFGIGVDLAPLRLPEEELLGALQRFTTAAARVGLQTYVQNAAPLSLISAASEMGLAFLDGDCISTVVDGPEPLHRFVKRDLYRPIIRVS